MAHGSSRNLELTFLTIPVYPLPAAGSIRPGPSFMFPLFAGQIFELDQVRAVVERAGGAAAAAAEGHLRRPQEPSEHR